MTASLQALLRARIRALLDKHGVTSVRSFERQLGRGHNWLGRKLDGTRPLYLRDIDLMLDHLDEPPQALIGRRKSDPPTD